MSLDVLPSVVVFDDLVVADWVGWEVWVLRFLAFSFVLVEVWIGLRHGICDCTDCEEQGQEEGQRQHARSLLLN